MDADPSFSIWLREIIKEAGIDLDRRGALRAFATEAGTDPGQTSRALSGKLKPSIDYLRAWTDLLQRKGSTITLREMLVHAGWATESELSPPATVTDMDLDAVAKALGVPPERQALFVAAVQSVAKTFADEPEPGTVA